MRSLDLAPPAVTVDPLPPTSPMVGWPARLRVAVELAPQPAYTWDDADPAVVWDAPGDVYVWDSPLIESGFTDVTCDFTGLEIEHGNPDELGLMSAGRALLTLANPAGVYSQYSADGRLVYHPPGRPLHVWAVVDGADWWLFSGRVARWDEQADGSVEVEAFNGFAELAAEIGDYIPGTAGQKPSQRIAAVAAAANYRGRLRLDQGDVTLTAQLTDRAPLEEMQIVALSDGGVVLIDADGTLVYRDRLWRAGRPDQVDEPVFSDNVCTVPAVVWDLILSGNDDALVTDVTLTNVAGTTVTATAGDLYGIDYPLTHPDPDQWTTVAEGQAVADYLIDQQSVARVSIERFVLHLTDPRQDLWRIGIDRRLGDRIRFLHEYPGAGGDVGTLDVKAIVSTIRHTINPDAWQLELAATKTVDYTAVERWDRTVFVWDDPDPAAVWRY